MKFKITKDGQDGTRETVWSKRCSEQEAREALSRIASEQLYEYRVTKTLPVWGTLRLFNEYGEQIAQES